MALKEQDPIDALIKSPIYRQGMEKMDWAKANQKSSERRHWCIQSLIATEDPKRKYCAICKTHWVWVDMEDK
jgi:hypothetical protein